MIHRLFGILLLIGSLGVVFYFEGESSSSGMLRLLHWPAMILTGIGPLSLILISYDGTVLLRTLRLLFMMTPAGLQDQVEREAMILHRLGQNFYENGPAAFENSQPRNVSPFVKRVIERLGVRVPFPDIRDLLLKERERTQIRIIQSLSVMALGVKLAPSIGMLGTILGMVRLLSTLEDPSKIGPSMSLALLTTFYGLFFSLVLWTPFQQKAERIFDIQLEEFDQTVRWLELLERRKPASYFADSAEIPEARRNTPNRAA